MEAFDFDQFSRFAAGTKSRRQILGALVGLAASSISVLGADARSRCRNTGKTCRNGSDCCSGICEAGSKRERKTCRAEPVCAGPVCGELCCPPESTGCTEVKLPSGEVRIGCLCPVGTEHRDGACKPIECPPGTNCSGRVDCGVVNSDDLCCQYPQTAYCACEDPDTGKPALGCCTPGIDCPHDKGWSGYAQAGNEGACIVDGLVVCCCETPDCRFQFESSIGFC